MTNLFLPLILLLTAFINKGSNVTSQNPGKRTLENTQYHVRNSREGFQDDSTILSTGWYYLADTDNGFKRQLDKSIEKYFIDPKPIVTAKNIITFEIYERNVGGQKRLGLAMQLDKEGTQNWSIATERSIGRHLAFVLDNRLLQVAKVNSQITGGMTALNRGDYSRQELENVRSIIERESK